MAYLVFLFVIFLVFATSRSLFKKKRSRGDRNTEKQRYMENTNYIYAAHAQNKEIDDDEDTDDYDDDGDNDD